MRQLIAAIFGIVLTLAVASSALADTTPTSRFGGMYLMSSNDGSLVAFLMADGRVRWELDGLPMAAYGVDDVAGGGEHVAVRWHAHGTHSEEMFGIPPTNRGIDIHGISFFRFDDTGKIVEDWVEENTLSVLQQLGVVPALG